MERLAHLTGMSVTNTSQHLQQLKRVGLVATRRDGTYIFYALADPEIVTLVRTLWHVTKRNVAELEQVVQRYYCGRDDMEPVTRDELKRLIRKRTVIVLDVRPQEEWAAGHVPSAVSVPVHELKRRLDEIPSGHEIVACCRGPYCVYSYEAIDILRPLGFKVRRLEGGFIEWLSAGLPVETETPSNN